MAYAGVLVLLFFFAHKSECQVQPATPTPNAGEDISVMRRIPGNCTSGQFDCGERCIPIKRFRDCHADCDDGSDEVCWPGFVRCLPTEAGCACVKSSDAAKLCPDRKDNKFCSLPPQQIFRCKNGNCIPNSWVKDQKNDCGDWSDEQLSALQPLH